MVFQFCAESMFAFFQHENKNDSADTAEAMILLSLFLLYDDIVFAIHLLITSDKHDALAVNVGFSVVKMLPKSPASSPNVASEIERTQHRGV